MKKKKKVPMKEKLKLLHNTAAVAYKASQQVNAERFIRNYDKYRRGSAVFWGLLFAFSMITGRYYLAAISGAVLHLQVLFNQLWWKLVNIEHFYLRRDNHEMEGVPEADTKAAE